MSLLMPHRIYNRITEITPQELHADKVTLLLVDVDNTLSVHGGQVPLEGLHQWLELMKNSGIKIMILSNAMKSRVKPFADALGVTYIYLGLKPLPFGYFRAMRKSREKRQNTAIVGDQLFTDILGGRLCGIKSYLVKPILPETGQSFIIRRKLENRILKNRNK
ncbi:MAG: YqeG family HAD IIIA-type phosphatase [Oscillospiraceae bacterium]